MKEGSLHETRIYLWKTLGMRISKQLFRCLAKFFYLSNDCSPFVRILDVVNIHSTLIGKVVEHYSDRGERRHSISGQSSNRYRYCVAQEEEKEE